MSKKSLIRQIKDRNNKFFSALRAYREKEILSDRESYSWKKYSYKIYPSSLRSLNMCPKKFIEEDVHRPPSFDVDQVYKMEVGTALHKMYQSEVLLFQNILWEKPSLQDELLIKKLELNWPEVPVWDPQSGISGRADLVLNLNNEVVIFDLKTTSVDRDKWDQYKKERLPSPSHIAQVAIYIYLINKYNYYSKKVKKGAIGYVNIAMAPGEIGSEYEYYFDYTEDMNTVVEELVHNLIRHRDAYLQNNSCLECTYKYCNVHNRNRDDRQD